MNLRKPLPTLASSASMSSALISSKTFAYISKNVILNILVQPKQVFHLYYEYVHTGMIQVHKVIVLFKRHESKKHIYIG